MVVSLGVAHLHFSSDMTNFVHILIYFFPLELGSIAKNVKYVSFDGMGWLARCLLIRSLLYTHITFIYCIPVCQRFFTAELWARLVLPALRM